MDDATLAEKAKTSQKYFALLYDRYIDIVYAFVRWRVNSDLDAEDIVSNAFMAIAKNITKFDNQKASCKTWILSIAYKKYLDFMRQTYKEESESLQEHNEPYTESKISTLLTNKIIYNDMITFAQSLPEQQAQIFFLRYVEDLKNKEIAEILDKNEKTISSQLSFVLSKIRKRFGHYLAEEQWDWLE